MVDVEELDIDPDAKQMMEQVADEMGFDLSEIQIPQNKLEALFEAVDEDEFKTGIEQAFKQLQK